jgi:glycosyltransferase involved in cell wall biosynthesis
LRILVAHNFYQQPGGEDGVFDVETAMLESRGHEVHRFVVHNDQVEGMSRLALVGATVWNRGIYAELRAMVRQHRLEVVHFHNTFPLISPAAYSAARAGGAAVVQTLHNFRLLCPSACFYRDGRVCEECLGKSVPWPAVKHRCYRESRAATAAVAVTLTLHHSMGTWRNGVDRFIAPTEFARGKFIEGGLPGERIAVKPNFVDPDPGVGSGGGGYAIFVGRLSQEKGLQTLADAWELIGDKVPLKIVGDGPLADRVRDLQARVPGVEWLGRLPLQKVYDLIGGAAVLIFPSACYETFGRVAAEAFAKGTPVIASAHGAMAEVVTHGRTGLLFKPGDPADLALRVDELLSDPARLIAYRQEARREFEAHYTGARNYQQLMEVYETALAGGESKEEAYVFPAV